MKHLTVKIISRRKATFIQIGEVTISGLLLTEEGDLIANISPEKQLKILKEIAKNI